ncbi:MAG: hypothetical protein V1847_05165 [Candidatus Diapherotrites archaeon]
MKFSRTVLVLAFLVVFFAALALSTATTGCLGSSPFKTSYDDLICKDSGNTWSTALWDANHGFLKLNQEWQSLAGNAQAYSRTKDWGPDLALDGNGFPYIAWYNNNQGDGYYAVYLQYWNGSSWNFPGLPGLGGLESAAKGSTLDSIFGKGKGMVSDWLAGGLNAVFLGAPSILAPWAFLLLLILAFIAAYLTFRISPRVLFKELLLVDWPEERKRLIVRVALALLFFFLPFAVFLFAGFVVALVGVLVEIAFWPVCLYGKKNSNRMQEAKELTVQ